MSVVREIVERYPIDGLHLDYVRYPNVDFDYSPGALAEFRATLAPSVPVAERQRLDRAAVTDPAAWPDALAPEWATFRRDRLTSLIRRIHGVVRTARPAIVLSAAVFPSPGGARDARLQDWVNWARAGWLDVVCPMIYTTDANEFSTLATEINAALGVVPFWAGIGAYRLAMSQTIEHVRLARRAQAAGVLLFSYGTDRRSRHESLGLVRAPPRSARDAGGQRRSQVGTGSTGTTVRRVHIAPVTEPFSAAREIITDGLGARAFPAAVVDVGRSARIDLARAVRLSELRRHAPFACRLDTIFDLASLTKVIATASIAMRLVGTRALSLDDTVSRHLASWRGADRDAVTVRHLLDHSSGLPAHARLWEQAAGRAEYERVLSALPLERAPGTTSVYSDPGFMLLGFMLDGPWRRARSTRSSRHWRRNWVTSLAIGRRRDHRERTAPTEHDPWRGRLLRRRSARRERRGARRRRRRMPDSSAPRARRPRSRDSCLQTFDKTTAARRRRH